MSSSTPHTLTATIARTHRIATALAAIIASATATPALADYEPAGLYFHTFQGTFNGSEWSTFGAIPGRGRYEFSDLTTEGTFPLTYRSDDTFTLDNSQGTGSFSDPNTGEIDFTITGGFNFHSELRRAPYTDIRFPTFYTGAFEGDDQYDGEWSATVRDVDPLTGATLSERSETVAVDVDGETIRITLADGSYHQAAWLSGDQAGFRVIGRPIADPDYQNFPGSMTSENLDLVGDLRISDADTIAVSLFFQTRAPLGSQVQTMTYLELSRIPSPAGAALLGIAALAPTRRRR